VSGFWSQGGLFNCCKATIRDDHNEQAIFKMSLVRTGRETFLMPDMCREAGVWIQPSPSLLQAAAAGWKRSAKLDEIMPNQSAGCSPGLKRDAWQANTTPASSGRLWRAEPMGDGGSGSEGLLPPWGCPSPMPHEMHSTAVFTRPGEAGKRLSACWRVFTISPRARRHSNAKPGG